MIEWISNNSQWIFSGIGVAVISLIGAYFKFFFKKDITKSNSLQNKTAIKNSENCNNGTTINASQNSQVIIAAQSGLQPNANNIVKHDKNAVLTIEGQKAQTNILFIDNEDFPIVNIIKKNGWKNCILIKKVSDLNTIKIKDAHIIFVDIKGVGEELFGKDAGLGVAKALKEKYSDKAVILYSAENNWNIFHDAISLVDDRIEKNAKPIEFISLIEMYADKIWRNEL